MDQYILDNVAQYQSLVASFRPAPPRAGQRKEDSAPNPDIAVTARVRPLLAGESSAGFVPGVFTREGADGIVDTHTLRMSARGKPAINSDAFRVDKAFGPDDTTENVYESVVRPLVPWAWSGGIGIMFAYGQTGSGKTYTVSGLEELVAGTLTDGTLEGERQIYVAIVELAGNSAHDLLNSRKPIMILEDSFGTTQLAGALEQHITSKEALLGAIAEAAAHRRTESTERNDASSRSHAICRLRLANPSQPAAEDGILYLVDLAGSEVARDVRGHDRERMREARDINPSLSVLKDCVRGRALLDPVAAARRRPLPHVPFRSSALTRLLKPVFDPAGTRSCRAAVVACVSPCVPDVPAGKNTLRYAEMLRMPGPKPAGGAADPERPATWGNSELRAWIEKDSGTPPIDGALLAPWESGIQLLRLPGPEFVARCLKTPGVDAERANAVKSKLWQMHVDGQKGKKQPTRAPRAASQDVAPGLTSQEPDPDVAGLPFRDRVRPGMVVRWEPPAGSPLKVAGVNMVLVLCPAGAAGPKVRDMRGEMVHKGGVDGGKEDMAGKFLCAVVSPAVFHEAYVINLWQHVVVDVEKMEAEVVLEFDAATRYYFIVV